MMVATALPLPERFDYAGGQVPLPFPPAPPVLPVPVEREDAGELRHRAARFVQAVAEVLYGHRPVRQLGGWLAADVFEHLQDHLRRNRAGGSRHRPRLASVHVSMLSGHAAEIAGRMVHAGRSHAIALRLERDDSSARGPRWHCTALIWA